jgi:hypothetical protein
MSIIISQNGKNARKLEKSAFDKEDRLQKYIYDNPDSIPLYDMKEDIRLLILAREFPTRSGPIDAIGVDNDGEIYIVETKLYKNPDKRTVLAQSLDYGAALWKHSSDPNEFLALLNDHVQRTFKVPLNQKLQEYFGLAGEDLDQMLQSVRTNLSDGAFHFVILMDALDTGLKDLILYVNQNSQFDIYAVELEYYKHEAFEIVIPRLFGAEVKKDLPTKSNGKQWNWDLFKERLSEYGDEAVNAAKQIIEWAEKNNVTIWWNSNQIGSFIVCFYTRGKKGFYPFSVKGSGIIQWNAPHQGNKCPQPFDKPEKRAEILERLKSIKGATVDPGNVDGYTGLRIPLRVLAHEDALRQFFSVCSWIQETLKAE